MPNEAEPALALQTRAEHGLKRLIDTPTLVMLLRNSDNDVVFEQTRRVLVHVKLDEGRRPKRRVAGDNDAKSLGQRKHRLLRQIRVQLDLAHGGLDSRIPHDINEQGACDVATVRDQAILHGYNVSCAPDSNVLYQPIIDQLFHCVPRLLIRRVLNVNLAVVATPLWGIAVGRIDVFQ